MRKVYLMLLLISFISLTYSQDSIKQEENSKTGISASFNFNIDKVDEEKKTENGSYKKKSLGAGGKVQSPDTPTPVPCNIF